MTLLQYYITGEATHPTPVEQYTIEEVCQHKVADDLWLIIDNLVYDLTEFVAIHPGGDMILLGAGIDATKLFIDNFHSKHARKTLSKYLIGTVAD